MMIVKKLTVKAIEDLEQNKPIYYEETFRKKEGNPFHLSLFRCWISFLFFNIMMGYIYFYIDMTLWSHLTLLCLWITVIGFVFSFFFMYWSWPEYESWRVDRDGILYYIVPGRVFCLGHLEKSSIKEEQVIFINPHLFFKRKKCFVIKIGTCWRRYVYLGRTPEKYLEFQ